MRIWWLSLVVVAFLGVRSSSGADSDVTSWWERLRIFLVEWDPIPNNRLRSPSADFAQDSTSLDNYHHGGGGLLGRIGDRDDVRDVHLYYFPDPLNPKYYEEINLHDSNQTLTNWDVSSKTKILVHGFVQNTNSEFPQNVKNAYLKRIQTSGQHMNILVLDWGRLAYQLQDGLPFYGRAVRNVVPVGNRLGEYILDLRSRGLLEDSLSSLHLIGHSLGAHVVGEAGHWIQCQVSYGHLMVGRITGSDPAGPYFYSGFAGRLLTTGDAVFMDVIHCNPGGLGTDTSGLGTAEFWVNWDPLTHNQPQCLVAGRIFTEGEEWNTCSHNYCPKFFAWSILNKRQARQCSKVLLRPHECTGHMAQFGEDISLSERGKFFIDIRENLDNMEWNS